MSAMSERHHDASTAAEHFGFVPRHPEPERPYTMDEWVEVRRRAAMEAWREANVTIDYGTAWRLTDAVLRAAMPERVPEEGA